MENWDTDVGSLVWFLTSGVIVPAVFLALAFWQPTQRQVARWGLVCGVVLTEANEGQVRSHLQRVRRYRSVAAFPFWSLASAPVLTGTVLPGGLSSPMPAIAAYVIGALAAELTIETPSTGTARSTPLVPRVVADYLPAWLHRLPWLLFAVAATLLAIAPLTADDGRLDGEAVAPVAVLLVLGALAEVAGRRIVARPQRGSDPAVLAADDGLRSVAVSTAVCGTGLASLAAVGFAGAAAGPTTQGGAGFLLSLVFGYGLGGAAVALLCSIVRQETFGYRRRHAVGPAPEPA